MRDFFASFNFEVRRPLESKTGVLYRDNLLQHFRLDWPSLEISKEETFEAIETFPVHCCTFGPSPSADKTIQGQKAFCIAVKNNKDGSDEQWYAQTEKLRREWCFLLRKHAVHHDIANGFKVSNQVLGVGAMAVVRRGRDLLSLTQQGMLKECCPRNLHTKSTEEVALKAIPKAKVATEEDKKLLIEEIRIAQAVSHEYCVSTREFVETRDDYVLVMEVVEGGELFEVMCKALFPEDEIKSLLRQILLGVAYLHSRGVCHRDLKPENFLLTAAARGKPATVKIADFGLAADVSPADPRTCLRDGARLSCSLGYGAPEVVRQQAYGLPCDLWSVGVCLYTLLSGVQPFMGADEAATRKLMQRGEYQYAPLQRRNPLAADLVARLLDRNPATRITAQAALEHPWVKAPLPPPPGPGGHRPSAGQGGGANGGDAEEEEEQAEAGCWGCIRRRAAAEKAFKDPSIRSFRRAQDYSSQIIPTTIDSSVRVGASPPPPPAPPLAAAAAAAASGLPLTLVRSDSWPVLKE